MSERYPPIEPFDHGLLDVGDGQPIYWETCGNRDGKLAVVLHGGPGPGVPLAHGVPSIRRSIASCCSISVAPAGARRMRTTPAPT